MSVVAAERLALEPRDLKYLFVASYFRLAGEERFSAESEPFIAKYLRNEFASLDESTLLRFIDYLQSMRLKFLIADRSVSMFKYAKPQFRFVCTRNNMDLLNFDDKVYVQPGTSVYATNLFVRDPRKFRLALYREFSRVYSEREFVSNDDLYCLLNGAAGYLFDDAYVDWTGVRICAASRATQPSHPYRLYLVGELMARHFSEHDITFSDEADFVLKNFHKGLQLFRNNYRLINSKKFTTRKPNRVFDEIRTELNAGSTHVKFIQRDYIYDANMPEDLLDALTDYTTDTSLYKYVTKFADESELESGANTYSEIVVDRYAPDKYRKMSVKLDANARFPSVHANEPSHLFVRPDIVQLKGTLNAFYVPRDGLVAILANNTLFGSNELLRFDMKLVKYTNSSPPRKLALDTYVVNKQQKLYLTRYVFGNAVPAYLLIRGDYESSFKSLHELKNPWVLNALLHLILTPELIERSLEFQHGGIAPAER
ncbi:LdOrf-20 peptide [Lymantria dispar multiple nucleopolyhedrovirus]|uniref:LdOrf-20 peptide n=1 Tax=Lymantria dispar multicapsid nuclear polyhedrosis virus TaxID=10449 RepID=Q9YMV4_NPVLD|nr:LdOrf-20 peptide [Lymantria dispar multiple nucleopolyhedrovirus]AAC70205.1 LdOrf-20 peptide [Lymantria dispar multiple nucleopolyhedrovirus]